MELRQPHSGFPQVDEKIKKDRAARLIALSKELEDSYANNYIGQELDMIIEQKNGNYMVGHTSNFLQVLLPYDAKLIKKEVKIKVIKVENSLIYGQLLEIYEN